MPIVTYFNGDSVQVQAVTNANTPAVGGEANRICETVALCNGDDLMTIAARDGITVKYLGEMLAFVFLSPKFVRAILEGRQPTAQTTNWLRRHSLPLSWADQDRILAQL